MNEKNIRWTILALIAIPILAAVWFCDSLYSSRDQAKLDQCTFQLKSIHAGYVKYKADHGGAAPKTLDDVKSYIFGQEQTFRCPSGLPSANYDPPFGGAPSKYIYDYHYLTSSGSDQIVCSDAEPHVIRHIVLKFLNHEVRNVLYADGRIVAMPENEFEALPPQAKTVAHK
ncbi:hypothetical protein CCAX7_19780 [Capsulimonas corticalis]|uniref:Uncharacterized protein n=1 Tax=Capsulimonas corticalis TaxID=2219043 RepID=A0A402D2J4_9BACT|nr:hypothetical protein [Capsulimonas corticalis]BDI29927.1 hypothetical protein CCAX7_19780 [Capsulimonas corticalis]